MSTPSFLLKCISGLLAGGLLTGDAAWAHGTTATVEHTIKVRVNYETGQPLADAQVSVYSPAEPDTPWTTGMTNASGVFEFIPTPAEPGNWEVVVRKAGHGEVVTIPIGTDSGALASGETLSSGQKLLIGAVVVWGCLGTALFFARRPTTRSSLIDRTTENKEV
ncbi:MAG: carboxypeptidase regulatory-like domain-containing protein [Leptolyngbya sp. SIO3F4]|nr:carboxypeptidase regulatory-like domain-containing protein [Leptolyngbya sp. SIO3F4]